MGQPVGVTVKETLDDDVRVFETDRWLTGMGSGLFQSPDEAPAGTMARMILGLDGPRSVHVYGNCLTVTKRHDAAWDELAETIRTNLENFYIYYPENVGRLKPPEAPLEGGGDEEEPDAGDDE